MRSHDERAVENLAIEHLGTRVATRNEALVSVLMRTAGENGLTSAPFDGVPSRTCPLRS